MKRDMSPERKEKRRSSLLVPAFIASLFAGGSDAPATPEYTAYGPKAEVCLRHRQAHDHSIDAECGALQQSMRKNIIIYGAPWCPYCQLVEDFFDERGIGYTSINVETHPDKAKEAARISGINAIPVTVVGEPNENNFIVGFGTRAEKKLSDMLGLEQSEASR